MAKYDNASHLCLYGNSKSKVCAVDMRTWTVVQSFETGVTGEGVKSLHFDDEKILCGTMSGTSLLFNIYFKQFHEICTSSFVIQIGCSETFFKFVTNRGLI